MITAVLSTIESGGIRPFSKKVGIKRIVKTIDIIEINSYNDTIKDYKYRIWTVGASNPPLEGSVLHHNTDDGELRLLYLVLADVFKGTTFYDPVEADKVHNSSEILVQENGQDHDNQEG